MSKDYRREIRKVRKEVPKPTKVHRVKRQKYRDEADYDEIQEYEMVPSREKKEDVQSDSEL